MKKIDIDPETLEGLGHLVEVYEQLKHVLGEYVLSGINEGLTKEMACNAFLREAYEVEVLNHGGLDGEKIEMYNNICRSFMWSKHGPQPRIKKGETNG